LCLKISPAGGFSFQIGKNVLFVFLLVNFRIKIFFLTDSKLLNCQTSSIWDHRFDLA
jgi:hypothetical protein